MSVFLIEGLRGYFPVSFGALSALLYILFGYKCDPNEFSLQQQRKLM